MSISALHNLSMIECLFFKLVHKLYIFSDVNLAIVCKKINGGIN